MGLQEEEEMQRVLHFLAAGITKSPDNFISYKVIARNCEMNEGEVKRICTSLEEDGFVQNDIGTDGHSYKITINGLILLEGYSGVSDGKVQISKINQIVKRGLEMIKMSNAEVQTSVVEIGRKYHLRDGLFYVVLIDLAGSTHASSKMSGIIFNEWIKKFLSITKEALNTKRKNLAVFVKSIGDGSLFLFRNFDDILDWKNKVDEFCFHHNNKCNKEGKLIIYQYHHKVIIHLSEIHFDEKNSDINSFGLNLVFKIEKKFTKSEIGITDVVRHLIVQDINAGKFRINDAENYSPDDGDYKIPLWKLIPVQ